MTTPPISTTLTDVTPSGHILPLRATWRAKSGAVEKIVAGLVRRGLATVFKGGHLRVIPPGAAPWNADDAGEPLYPFVTPAGLAAIGIEPEGAAEAAPAPTTGAEAVAQPTPARGPSRRCWPRCSGGPRAPPPRRSPQPPAGSIIRSAAPSPAP